MPWVSILISGLFEELIIDAVLFNRLVESMNQMNEIIEGLRKLSCERIFDGVNSI